MADSGFYNSNATLPNVTGSGPHLPFDSEGGIELSQIQPGTILEVQTKNNAYTVIPQESGEMLIWGHPEYCPEPILTPSLGSAYLTGVLRLGYLGPGMRLTFPTEGRRVITSRIVALRAKPKN